MISNKKIPVHALCGMLLAGICAADTVTLAGGKSRLTGTVRSIDGSGRVELASELATAPLLLKGAAVDRIEFEHRQAVPGSPTTLVELTNGDVIPATIESFDGSRLTVVSSDVGRLAIPRHAIRTLQTGIHQRRLIYQGPKGPEEWSARQTHSGNWSFEDKTMIAKGQATAAQDVGLTRQFIMRFTLVWEAGKVPNFKVYFADPLAGENETVDRYYLQFAGAGFELKREAAKGRRYNTLMILNRSHAAFPDNRVRVELRVNRDTARIELLLNGESEGEIADPITGVPTGTGIAFECYHRDGTTQEIRDIEILEHDDSRARHRAENRGDPDSDSLITRDESRWTGTLTAIRKTGDGLLYSFKVPKQEGTMELPEEEVSTVFISGGGKAAPATGSHPFILRLHPHGSLTASTCVFNDREVSADHPLLGPLTLRKGSIAAIERVHTEPPAEP